jgi:hypothetical protein
MTPAQFHDALREYCHVTSASTTSGGRTRQHNRAVGGVEDSAHLIWMAEDVVYDHDDPPAWRERMAQRLGLTLIHEGDHDHVQGG